MDWRDLIAWQQPREVVVTAGGIVGRLQLCGQDPHRCYVRFSLTVPLFTPLYLSINPNPTANSGGIPVGGGLLLPKVNAAGLDLSTVATVNSADIPFTFDVGAGTGSIAASAAAATITMDLAQFGVLVFTPVTGARVNSGPLSVELWADRHGALCQVPWFVYDPLGSSVWSVLSMSQDESPCDRKPKVVPRGRFVRGLWLPQCHQPDGGGGNDIDPDSSGEQPPLWADSEPDLAQPLLDLLRRARGDR